MYDDAGGPLADRRITNSKISILTFISKHCRILPEIPYSNRSGLLPFKSRVNPRGRGRNPWSLILTQQRRQRLLAGGWSGFLYVKKTVQGPGKRLSDHGAAADFRVISQYVRPANLGVQIVQRI
jgi:hypothetical protein